MYISETVNFAVCSCDMPLGIENSLWLDYILKLKNTRGFITGKMLFTTIWGKLSREHNGKLRTVCRDLRKHAVPLLQARQQRKRCCC